MILKDFHVLPPLILDSRDPVLERFTTSSSILVSLFRWVLVAGSLLELNPFSSNVLSARIRGSLLHFHSNLSLSKHSNYLESNIHSQEVFLLHTSLEHNPELFRVDSAVAISFLAPVPRNKTTRQQNTATTRSE